MQTHNEFGRRVIEGVLATSVSGLGTLAAYWAKQRVGLTIMPPGELWWLLWLAVTVLTYLVLRRRWGRPGHTFLESSTAPPGAIDISIGQLTSSNFVGCTAYVDRDQHKTMATYLSAHLDDLRITNNSNQATTIEELWIEADGVRPLETDKCNVTPHGGGSLKSDRFIGSMRPRSFTLDYSAVFSEISAPDELSGRFALCVKAAAIGVARRTIPDWLLIHPAGRGE